MSSFSGLQDWATGLALIIFSGDTAVVVFFVMSGLVLHESLIRSKEGWLRLSAIFAIKRIFRIYPAVIMCTLITAAMGEFWQLVELPTKIFTEENVIQNLTLQGNLVLGVSWTLTIEILSIAFILPVFFINRLAGVSAMAIAVGYSLIATENKALVFGITNMHQAMLAMIAGMALASPQAKAVFSTFGKWTWAPLLVFLLFGYHINGAWTPSSVILRVMCASLFVGTLRYATNSKIDYFLSSKPSQYLGTISFSFYIFNVPILYAAYALTPSLPAQYAVVAGLPLAIITGALTVPIAAIMYRLIEVPGIRIGSNISSWISSKERVQAAATDSH